MSPQSAASYFTPRGPVVQELKVTATPRKKGSDKHKEREKEWRETESTENVRKRQRIRPSKERQEISHALGGDTSAGS